jgi:hypothetical protein
MDIIDLNCSVPAGALLGTSGSKSIIDDINNSYGMHSDYFGSVNDVFKSGRETFVSSFITDIMNEANKVKIIANQLFEPDGYKAIITEDDLINIPSKMILPILLEPEVRSLLKEGRIDGFGYDEANLPEEDYYGRLCNNGYVEDTLSALDEKGNLELTFEFEDTDPELSLDEMDYIMETRQYIKNILRTTYKDPTNYPMSRS